MEYMEYILVFSVFWTEIFMFIFHLLQQPHSSILYVQTSLMMTLFKMIFFTRNTDDFVENNQYIFFFLFW